MRICTIICEFNPLHNGHIRLLEKAKELGEVVCCVFSGNFVQRGMPAVANKYDRASLAIRAGADVVLELPTVFACASAENFAWGAVRIANAIGSSVLLFGTTSGDIYKIEKCAKEIDSIETKQKIKDYLKLGRSYAWCVSNALPEYDYILEHPNDILALEYIRASKQIESNVSFATLQRKEGVYQEDDKGFCTSSSIRNGENFSSFFAPEYSLDLVDTKIEARYKDFAKTFLSIQAKEYLSTIEGVIEGLENKIVNERPYSTFDDMIHKIKSKRYTFAKIQRIVLSSILNINKDVVTLAKNTPPCTNVLAIKKEKANEVLSYLSKKIVTNENQADGNQKQIYKIDKTANDLYSGLTGDNFDKNMRIL